MSHSRAHDVQGAPRGAPFPSAEAIESWIIERLAEHLQMDPARIDPNGDLPALALDSAKAVEVASELGAVLGREVTPTLLWDHESIRALARHLAPKV
jgi:acyl carrier protein